MNNYRKCETCDKPITEDNPPVHCCQSCYEVADSTDHAAHAEQLQKVLDVAVKHLESVVNAGHENSDGVWCIFSIDDIIKALSEIQTLTINNTKGE